ncbi:MAG: hypothetical protein AAGH92_03465 [Planctomycetota bacterium]
MRGLLLVLLAWLGSAETGGSAMATPLEDGRARQAATYTDGDHPDQPALYALLADVAEWSGGEGDEAGAVVVDWSEVLADPAGFRGAKVLVEGTDAGRRRRVSLVRRQPPWGDAVTEWGVAVADDAPTESGPAQEALPPVVVWFVDPDDTIGETRHGRRVRLAGRFLGTWNDVDALGVERTYPIVVARGVRSAGQAGSGGAEAGWGQRLLAVMGAALGLMVLWRVSKVFGRVDVVGRRRSARGAAANDEPADVDEDILLPEEADAALGVLADRHDRGETT